MQLYIMPYGIRDFDTYSYTILVQNNLFDICNEIQFFTKPCKTVLIVCLQNTVSIKKNYKLQLSYYVILLLFLRESF